MKLSDMFFAVLYGVAFILIIYFFITLFYRPSTVIIYDEQPVYYDRQVWWPWGTNSYNYWPYWSGWWNGGGGGGYNYYRPRHHGGIRPHGGAWSGRPWGGTSIHNSGTAPGPSVPSSGGSAPSGSAPSGPSGGGSAPSGGGSAPSGP